mmetsp:Transcript_23613/g.45882  ORF Transcript_23613/g.45882 Transcript_23613/m.45882 type:complete len:213 (+) Transcript_23613:308-946(+)
MSTSCPDLLGFSSFLHMAPGSPCVAGALPAFSMFASHWPSGPGICASRPTDGALIIRSRGPMAPSFAPPARGHCQGAWWPPFLHFLSYKPWTESLVAAVLLSGRALLNGSSKLAAIQGLTIADPSDITSCLAISCTWYGSFSGCFCRTRFRVCCCCCCHRCCTAARCMFPSGWLTGCKSEPWNGVSVFRFELMRCHLCPWACIMLRDSAYPV